MPEYGVNKIPHKHLNKQFIVWPQLGLSNEHSIGNLSQPSSPKGNLRLIHFILHINSVRHKNCIDLYRDRIDQELFFQTTYFNLARCSQSCLNAFDEQKKA